MYESYNKGFERSNSPVENTKTTAEFKQFKLTEAKGLNFESDFTFNPKKFFCKKHPGVEIEFCCEITEETSDSKWLRSGLLVPMSQSSEASMTEAKRLSISAISPTILRIFA